MTKRPKKKQPLWKGPDSPDPLRGGLTQSLLGGFLVCRERFRLKVVEGLREEEGFSYYLEFGNYIHEAEDAHASGKNINRIMRNYADKLISRFPTDQAEILKWYRIAKLMHPLYLKYWKTHKESTNRKYIFAEEVFKIKYILPSGRMVYLRGKWDEGFTEGKGVWLQENKCKGDIDEQGLQATVDQDLQVMIYLITLSLSGKFDPKDVLGVLYNVFRRPFAMYSKHNIRQRQNETQDQYYKRFATLVDQNPGYFFMRWRARIFQTDLARFRKEILDPLLESLWDWWEWIQVSPFKPYADRYQNTLQPFLTPKLIKPNSNYTKISNTHHWRTPFGVYNSLAQGRRGDYFALLTQGRRGDLVKAKTLFPELAE